MATKTWYLLSCRCQWWFSIDKLAIHSSLEKLFFPRFNKAFLCFFLWDFLFLYDISFFRLIFSFLGEGGRGVSPPLVENLPTPCNFCISSSPLRAKPLLESWNNFFSCLQSFTHHWVALLNESKHNSQLKSEVIVLILFAWSFNILYLWYSKISKNWCI